MSTRFAGHRSTTLLLGRFQVSILHNLVHLLFGIVGALVRCSPAGSGTENPGLEESNAQ